MENACVNSYAIQQYYYQKLSSKTIYVLYSLEISSIRAGATLTFTCQYSVKTAKDIL